MQAQAELIFLKNGSYTEPKAGYSLFKQRALIDNLRSAGSNLRTPKTSSICSDYNQKTNYSKDALDHKKAVVAAALRKLAPDTVLDLGANTGRFSRLRRESSYVIVS